MRKLLSLLFVCIAFFANAYDFMVDGLCYNFLGDSTSVYVVSSNDNSSLSGELIIPDNVSYNGVTYKVTEVGYNAFNGCKNITSLSIGNNIKLIGEIAFQGCSGITNLYLGENVKEIGKYAFQVCKNIHELFIPNSVEVIDDGAFMMCTGIDTISIGNNVKLIGRSAFDMCTSLRNVTIPNSVYVIGDNVFWKNTSLINLIIGENVASIGESAFSNCTSLQNIIALKSTAVDLPYSAIEEVSRNCVVHVRKGSKWRYQNKTAWFEFPTIIEDAEDFADISGGSGTPIIGDVNGDGSVNAADVTIIYNIILGTE